MNRNLQSNWMRKVVVELSEVETRACVFPLVSWQVDDDACVSSSELCLKRYSDWEGQGQGRLVLIEEFGVFSVRGEGELEVWRVST